MLSFASKVQMIPRSNFLKVVSAFHSGVFLMLLARVVSLVKRGSGRYTRMQKCTKGTKKYIFNCFWASGKRGSQLVCCTILVSQLSLNVFVIWELIIQYNPHIFVLVNRFYVLTTQCQQWSDCAFCTLSLKRHTNSFVAVENNPMPFCIRLAHI